MSNPRYNPMSGRPASAVSSGDSTPKDSVLPFVRKTYGILNDVGNNDIIGWGEGGNSFIVKDTTEFAAKVLPQHFKHTNFCSFVRQLNTYGFAKVDSKLWEFRHECFRAGRPELLSQIMRRKTTGKKSTDSDGHSEIVRLREHMNSELSRFHASQHQNEQVTSRLVAELRQYRGVVSQMNARMDKFQALCVTLVNATAEGKLVFADKATEASVMGTLTNALRTAAEPTQIRVPAPLMVAQSQQQQQQQPLMQQMTQVQPLSMPMTTYRPMEIPVEAMSDDGLSTGSSTGVASPVPASPSAERPAENRTTSSPSMSVPLDSPAGTDLDALALPDMSLFLSDVAVKTEATTLESFDTFAQLMRQA